MTIGTTPPYRRLGLTFSPAPCSLHRFAGITQQLFVDWLSLAFNPAEGVPGMAEDEAAGKFAGDDLLAQVRSDFDAFYWQSHTLTHLARDNLGANDCDIEDGGGFRRFGGFVGVFSVRTRPDCSARLSI